MLAIVALQFWTLGRLREETTALQRLTKDRLGLSVRINAYQDDGFARTMELVATAGPLERRHLIDEIDDLSAKAETIIKAYAENLGGMSVRARFDNLIATRQRYLKIRTQVIELVTHDRQPEALAIAQTALHQSYSIYSQAVDELLIGDSQSVHHHAVRVNQFCSIIVFLVPAIGLLGFFIGFIVPILGFVFMGKNVYEPNLATYGGSDNQGHPSLVRVTITILAVLIILIVLGIVARRLAFFP